MYQAQIFLVSNSASATPAACAIPTATPSATATASATPTATATPGASSVSPANLKFRPQRVGTTSRARFLKVANDGAVTEIFTAILPSGDFAQSNTCAASLAAMNSCTVSVTFKPTAGGERTGNLPLRDDALNSPQVVDLSGKGARR